MAFVDTHRTNWSAADAVAFANAEAEKRSQSWSHLCLNFCAHAYGFSSSGTRDVDLDGDSEAIEYWDTAKPAFKHPGDERPPVGALACWRKPTGGAGHIALVVRSTENHVRIASNDIVADGDIDVVDLGRIARDWHHTYLGWVEPDFPRGAGTNTFGKAGDAPHGISVSALQLAAATGGTAPGVLKVQQALHQEYPDFDFSSGPGVFGPLTRQTYTRWQRDQPEHFTGKSANGEPGRLTLERLGKKHHFAVVD
ncbi:MAG: hypothetical protein WAK18_10340 [Nocardioidaceae bacterium]